MLSHLCVYGTWRMRACRLASDRPSGSKGSLASVGSWLMGMTTGVRSIITSDSRRALTCASQSVESRTRVADFPLFSPGSEEPAPGWVAFGSASRSLSKSKIMIAMHLIGIENLLLHSIFIFVCSRLGGVRGHFRIWFGRKYFNKTHCYLELAPGVTFESAISGRVDVVLSTVLRISDVQYGGACIHPLER
jgi:hypothetical protein